MKELVTRFDYRQYLWSALPWRLHHRSPGDAVKGTPPSLLVGYTFVELTHPLRKKTIYTPTGKLSSGVIPLAYTVRTPSGLHR